MKCEHCPVKDGPCWAESGSRPHCRWIAEGRHGVAERVLRYSHEPPPPPDPDVRARRMLGPAYHRCPHRKPLPPELREGCGCIAWCELGRSEKPHHKVDPTDCGNCIRAGGWPGYSPEEHGTL